MKKGLRFYNIDAKGVKTEVPLWEYGLLNEYTPTHNFELLNEFRLKRYEIEKAKFIEERKSKKLETTEFELNCFYVAWLKNELKVIEIWLSDKYPNGQPKSRPSTSDQIEILKYETFIKSEQEKTLNSKLQGKNHLLSIPTNATPDQILNFWVKLQDNNEKGEPYWESKEEIEHFVYQNFEDFLGVDEIKEFNPNMNKSELYHVTWTFYHKYGKSKTKRQYEKLLLENFAKFRNARNVYSNIKDQFNDSLKRIFH